MKPIYGPNGVGVAGWLGVVWLYLVFGLPFGSAYLVWKALNHPIIRSFPGQALTLVEISLWTAAVTTGAVSWYLAWRLSYRQVWRTVEVVVAGFWFIALGTNALEFVGLSLATGLPLFSLIAGGWPAWARSAIIAVLATAYFPLRRVARTYPRVRKGPDVTQVFD